MTSQGSPYARFQRALSTGNLRIIRAAAAEMPRVGLDDALTICLAIHAAEPQSFERAALRWLSRFCLERKDVTLADLRAAAAAFEAIATTPTEAADRLRRLVHR